MSIGKSFGRFGGFIIVCFHFSKASKHCALCGCLYLANYLCLLNALTITFAQLPYTKRSGLVVLATPVTRGDHVMFPLESAYFYYILFWGSDSVQFVVHDLCLYIDYAASHEFTPQSVF